MSVRSNIWKLYVIKASKWLALFMPTIVLFFQEHGMTLQDIMVLQAIYSIVVALIEIPSGYLADVLGRKKALVIGTFFGVVGMLIYAFSYDFWFFLLAALSLGIGQSFLSGSDTALMYDSLLEMNRPEAFVKYEGRTVSMGNFAEALGCIIGGFLAEITLRTPFFYQVGIAFVGFVTACFLVEPWIKKSTNPKNAPWKNIQSIMHYALVKNDTLRYYIFYSSIIGAGTLIMAWLIQPYFKVLDIRIKYFGMLAAILNLAVAVASFYAHRIEEKMSAKKLICLILLALGSIYFLVGYYFVLGSLLLLFLFYLVRGVATPILRDYINRQVPSEMRATVMSLRSFIIRILFASISPFLGYIADVYSIREALFLSGAIITILGLITLWFLMRTKPLPKT